MFGDRLLQIPGRIVDRERDTAVPVGGHEEAHDHDRHQLHAVERVFPLGHDSNKEHHGGVCHREREDDLPEPDARVLQPLGLPGVRDDADDGFRCIARHVSQAPQKVREDDGAHVDADVHPRELGAERRDAMHAGNDQRADAPGHHHRKTHGAQLREPVACSEDQVTCPCEQGQKAPAEGESPGHEADAARPQHCGDDRDEAAPNDADRQDDDREGDPSGNALSAVNGFLQMLTSFPELLFCPWDPFDDRGHQATLAGAAGSLLFLLVFVRGRARGGRRGIGTTHGTLLFIVKVWNVDVFGRCDSGREFCTEIACGALHLVAQTVEHAFDLILCWFWLVPRRLFQGSEVRFREHHERNRGPRGPATLDFLHAHVRQEAQEKLHGPGRHNICRRNELIHLSKDRIRIFLFERGREVSRNLRDDRVHDRVLAILSRLAVVVEGH